MKNQTTRLQILLAVAAMGMASCGEPAKPIDEKALTDRLALYAEATIHEAGPALSFTVADEGTVKKVIDRKSVV